MKELLTDQQPAVAPDSVATKRLEHGQVIALDHDDT